MPTSLQNTITELAASFASSVVNALRGMSLEEILAATSASSGRGARVRAAAPAQAPAAPAEAGGRGRARKKKLGRRSPTAIAGLVEKIVSLLAGSPSGLRAEQIRDKLGLASNELPRPIAEALASRRISKQGQKRATTYFAAKSGGGAAAAPASPRGASAGRPGRPKRAGATAKKGAKKGAKRGRGKKRG